jgi:Outer membrane protein beta-barrel domain
MKKVCFLVFAIFIISASRIQAQSFHLGVKVGTNLARIDGRAFTDGFEWGYTVGAFAELNIDKKWGVQPEVLFNQTNTQTADGFGQIIPDGVSNVSVKMNYLTIPLLLSYKPIPVLSFQLGPQFGILMSTNQTVVGNGEKAFKNGDISIVGGAQVNLGHFKAGARYIYGLSDLNGVNDADTWKNQNIQIYVGLRIF